MGEPAVALPAASPSAPVPSPTPPASPPPATPSSPPPADPSAPAPERAAPPAAAPDDADLATRPGTVDLRRYKAERARWTGQIADLERKVAQQQQIEQQLAESRRQFEAASRRAQHFDALSRVIRQDKELAGRIEELIGELPEEPSERAAAIANLPPEALRGFAALDKLAARAEQQERAAKQRQEQLELQETAKELRESFRPVLEKRHMPVDAFTPMLEAYVLRRLNAMGEAADFDEVPYLVAEFVKPLLQWHNDENARLATGKQDDARLPASAESTSPIHPAAPKHANDETTTRLAETFLKGKLGWTG